jgi:hypothetical protein
MSAALLQLGLAAFGIAAVAMAMSGRARLLKWSPVVGIAGQPLWICYLVAKPQDWGIAALVVAYTAAYGLGIWHQWRPEIQAWFDWMCVDLDSILQLEQRACLDPDDGRLFEAAGLAKTIADQCARADVESYCTRRYFSSGWYYDTADLRMGDPFEQDAVPRAVRYLDLRDALVRHPTQPALVRFRT